jgi:hypothetical protein
MRSFSKRWRPLAWPAAIAASYFVLSRVIIAIGAVQQVLGAVRPNPLALAALVALYVLRLATLFIVPGWTLVALYRLRPAERDAARSDAS